MTLDEIYRKMSYVIHNVKEVVKTQKEKGRKLVGIIPVYGPEELVHAAGMLPIGLWGGYSVLTKAPAYLPPFACSIVQNITEFAANGLYDDLDAIIGTYPCDTLRCVTQYIEGIFKDRGGKIKMIRFSYPKNNTKDSAMRFLISELKDVRAALEEVAGKKILEADLKNSIRIYNENREAMLKFTSLLADKPGLVSAKMRHTVIKSRYFMDKEDHTKLMLELNRHLEELPAPDFKGKKIFLAGIMCEPDALLDIFDELNMAVVGDELAHESKQFQVLVPEGLEQINRLALQWKNVEGCGFVNSVGRKRANKIVQLMEQCKPDGVVFCMYQFCDVDEFDFPGIRDAVVEVVPILDVGVDQNTASCEQARTRLQAFNEQMA